MITVGMNYRVRPGKERDFEEKFASVLGAMRAGSGHVATHLYRDVAEPASYLIVSEWEDRQRFGAFLRSEEFRRVTDWGRAEILAERPKHVVYDRSEPV